MLQPKAFKILALSCFIFLAAVLHVYAQPTQITHTGVQAIGTNTVTVSAVGASPTGLKFTSYCGTSPYHIGQKNNTLSGVLFQFSTPVSYMKFEVSASGDKEVLTFKVNGASHNVATTDLSPFAGACNMQFCASVSGGTVIFSTNNTSGNAGTTIMVKGTLSSVEITHPGIQAGSVFNAWFGYGSGNDTTIAIPRFGDTLVCRGDTIEIPFSVSGSLQTGNILSVQLSDATGSFANPVVIGTLATTATSGTVKCVIPPATATGTQYRTRIVASAPVLTSQEVNMTIISTKTGPTISITASPGTHVWPDLEVTFTANTGNTGTSPRYQWKKNGVDIPNSNDPVYKSTTLKKGDTICCVVTSDFLCAVPQTANSNCLGVDVDLGVESGKASRTGISLYPNPVTDKLQIELTQEIHAATVWLTDITGKPIAQYSLKAGSNTIDMRRLPAGMYFLKLATDDGLVKTEKIMKQ